MNGEPAEPTARPDMVDLVFPLEGRTLPRDHRLALVQALEQAMPGLTGAAELALHPVNLVDGCGEHALLSRRSRLTLRVRRADLTTLSALGGQPLDVAGHRLRVGMPHPRELLPHGTLYAHFVAAGDAGEAAFLAGVDRALAALGVHCRAVCGRHQRIRVGPAAAGAGPALLGGFSLMLHGLAPAQALRILECGIGAHRRLGCGVFVPHRSAAAAGL